MKLHQLLYNIDMKTGLSPDFANTEVHGIADNSIDVQEGYVFVAIQGFSSDGHEFIEDAIKKGASLIIGEQDLGNLSAHYIQVANSRKALGIIAQNFYGDPAKHKLVIGVTGTNGKTTTSYMLKHILESNGKSCSVIGTIQNVINGMKTPSFNTTPSSLVLHKLLSLSNDEVIIMEVSSHGLSQYRIEGISFDYCLFTNLHHEHLDYHGSMEDYFQAKLLLFEKLKTSGIAIVNTDDSWGEKLADTLLNEGKKVYRIGKSSESQLRIADFDLRSSTAAVEESNEFSTVFSSMDGIHNMYNTVMAFGTAILVGISKECILQSLPQFEGVEGRFEIAKQSNGSTVIVDYAHTPDAISHCLITAKQLGAKRIIHVFGFRGNRDPSKRQEMMTITAGLSDQYILTLDDLNSVPASEMIESFIYLNDIYGNEKGCIISDRTLAIKKAITESQLGDWILITGKGHEQYQQRYQLPTESDRDTVQYLAKPK